MTQMIPPTLPDAEALPLAAESATRRSTGAVIRDYVTFTKPKIISLLLVTAAGGMFLAAQGVPSPNHAGMGLDRRGARFRRSQRHQSPAGSGTLTVRCTGLKAARWRENASTPVMRWPLASDSTWLHLCSWPRWSTCCAAGLTLLATLIYVFVYTLWLKRTTPNNIVIGGAAGAIPPMVGWAAVTGTVDLPAVFLFAIVFFWTPPHFWALSLLIEKDYARAGVPMLPVVSSAPANYFAHFPLFHSPYRAHPDVWIAAGRGHNLRSVRRRFGCAVHLAGLTIMAARRAGPGQGYLPVFVGLSGAAVRGRDGGRRAVNRAKKCPAQIDRHLLLCYCYRR